MLLCEAAQTSPRVCHAAVVGLSVLFCGSAETMQVDNPEVGRLFSSGETSLRAFGWEYIKKMDML